MFAQIFGLYQEPPAVVAAVVVAAAVRPVVLLIESQQLPSLFVPPAPRHCGLLRMGSRSPLPALARALALGPPGRLVAPQCCRTAHAGLCLRCHWE